jgi:hypothetical protein
MNEINNLRNLKSRQNVLENLQKVRISQIKKGDPMDRPLINQLRID